MSTPFQNREKQIDFEQKCAKVGVECINSFYFFFKTFWPEMSGDTYIDARHIEYICNTIQEKAMPVLRGEFSMETLIINVPPGSSKSTVATIAFPMWVWLHSPYLSSTNVSYSASLSERHARKARGITSSLKWKYLFDNIFLLKYKKTLQIITQNKNGMTNNFKGERFNTSVDGSITGMHADFIIKDDMQDPQQASSDTQREHANHWDEATLTSRHKKPNSWLDIIIAQRLHESDLTGYTLNKNIKVTQISLPAEITAASPVVPASAISLYTDGVLDPNRRPKEVLEAIKAQMGSVAYTCQYLQAPFNLEEQDIKPAMFEIIQSVPDDLVWDLWVDAAYTEKTINDPTGIDLIAKWNNNIVVKQSWDVWKKLPDLLKFIVELEREGLFDKSRGRIFIEPKASGNSLADYIEHETDYNFVRIGEHAVQERKLVQGGHYARHEVIKPKAESHRIKLLKGNWNDGFITQICGFPRAAHDEHVDTLGYAINHYFFAENSFIDAWAIDSLEKKVMDSVPIFLTGQYSIREQGVKHEVNERGDIELFDFPIEGFSYRYVCCMVLRTESERPGSTAIVVVDRITKSTMAIFRSKFITHEKAAVKAIEMASYYSEAKLIIAVQGGTGMQNEAADFSHIAIREARAQKYRNIYIRLKENEIKKQREREYGFEVNPSSQRETYYNLKVLAESNKLPDIPEPILNDIKVVERKKATGEIAPREGQTANLALAYAIALQVSDEMQVKPYLKKNAEWRNLAALC